MTLRLRVAVVVLIMQMVLLGCNRGADVIICREVNRHLGAERALRSSVHRNPGINN